MQSVSSPVLRVAVELVVRAAVLSPRMLRDHACATNTPKVKLLCVDYRAVSTLWNSVISGVTVE